MNNVTSDLEQRTTGKRKRWRESSGLFPTTRKPRPCPSDCVRKGLWIHFWLTTQFVGWREEAGLSSGLDALRKRSHFLMADLDTPDRTDTGSKWRKATHGKAAEVRTVAAMPAGHRCVWLAFMLLYTLVFICWG